MQSSNYEEANIEWYLGPRNWSREDVANVFGVNIGEEAVEPERPDPIDLLLGLVPETPEKSTPQETRDVNVSYHDFDKKLTALEIAANLKRTFWLRPDVIDLTEQIRIMENVIRGAHSAFVEVADEATSEFSEHGYKTHVWEALYTAEKKHKDARDKSYAHYCAAHADLVGLLKDEGIDTADVTSERERFDQSLTYRGQRPPIQEDVAAQHDDASEDLNAGIVESLLFQSMKLQDDISERERAIVNAQVEIGAKREHPHNREDCYNLTIQLTQWQEDVRLLHASKSEIDLVLRSIPSGSD
jgi:hypothetical protein